MFEKTKAMLSMNQNQVDTWLKVAMGSAFVAYVIGVFYADSMFISVMQEAFPANGLFRTLANVGAITTALSAVGILLAKMFWFSTGAQSRWGWLFWIADIIALSLNAILAYQIATLGIEGLEPFMHKWMGLAPATPLLPVVGWGVAIKLDKNQALRQAYLDMDFDLIQLFRREMTVVVNTEPVQAFLQKAAMAAAANTLQEQTGMRASDLLRMANLDDHVRSSDLFGQAAQSAYSLASNQSAAVRDEALTQSPAEQPVKSPAKASTLDPAALARTAIEPIPTTPPKPGQNGNSGK